MCRMAINAAVKKGPADRALTSSMRDPGLPPLRGTVCEVLRPASPQQAKGSTSINAVRRPASDHHYGDGVLDHLKAKPLRGGPAGRP